MNVELIPISTLTSCSPRSRGMRRAPVTRRRIELNLVVIESPDRLQNPIHFGVI